MSITLYKGAKSQGNGVTYTTSQANLLQDGNFTTADVNAGNWIFYHGKNYHGPSVKKQRHVESDVSISNVNGSVFLVEEGLILFKDTDFRGDRKVLRI